jgi:hypothetical protein
MTPYNVVTYLLHDFPATSSLGRPYFAYAIAESLLLSSMGVLIHQVETEARNLETPFNHVHLDS